MACNIVKLRIYCKKEKKTRIFKFSFYKLQGGYQKNYQFERKLIGIDKICLDICKIGLKTFVNFENFTQFAAWSPAGAHLSFIKTEIVRLLQTSLRKKLSVYNFDAVVN